MTPTLAFLHSLLHAYFPHREAQMMRGYISSSISFLTIRLPTKQHSHFCETTSFIHRKHSILTDSFSQRSFTLEAWGKLHFHYIYSRATARQHRRRAARNNYNLGKRFPKSTRATRAPPAPRAYPCRGQHHSHCFSSVGWETHPSCLEGPWPRRAAGQEG